MPNSALPNLGPPQNPSKIPPGVGIVVTTLPKVGVGGGVGGLLSQEAVMTE